MKTGANEPCPCGSGLKYKKCCRGKPGEGEPSPALETTASAGEAWGWESQSERWGVRYLSLQETRRLLSSRNKRFLTAIQSLLEEEREAAWLEGLARIEAIPWEAAMVLHGVTDLHASLLQRLGREDEALRLQAEQLLAVNHDELWWKRGMMLLSWFHHHASPDERSALLGELEEICRRSRHPVPALLWTDLACPLDDAAPDKTAALYRQALAPERWRQAASSLSPWLPLLHQALVTITPWLWQRERPKQATTFARMLQRFPWNEWDGGAPASAVDAVGLTLSRMERWDELAAFCQQVRASTSAPGVVDTWLGLVAQAQGQREEATAYFSAAMDDSASLHEQAVVAFVAHFFAQKAWPEMARALELFDDPDRPDILHYRLTYHLALGEYDEVLALSDQIRDLSLDDLNVRVRRWMLLETLQEEERLAGELEQIQAAQPETPLGRMALVFLGLLDVRHLRYASALERLENAEAEAILEVEGAGVELWARVLEARGQATRALGDDALAFPWLAEALRLHPTEWRYHQALVLLIRMERFAEAQTLWEQAQAAYPDSMHIRYSRFLIAEHHQDWEQCWDCLEAIGVARFRNANLLKEGLFLSMRALVYLDRWWDALLLCEDHLDDILADDDLSALRNTLVQEVGQRFRAMEEELGQREGHLQQLQERHQHLFATLERTRQKRDALRDALDEQEGLQQQLVLLRQREQEAVARVRQEGAKQRAAADKARFDAFAQERSDIVAPLPSSLREILRSAETLWSSLAVHPEHDHGPVVLQLARVVEGAANRWWIDSFVGLVLREGGRLADLPSVTTSALKAEHNRLSLGDVASVLSHRMVRREADGSSSVEINPLSSAAHREWLRAFWASEQVAIHGPDFREWAEHTLPTALRGLAKVRNRASHATQPISRREAGRVRVAILGEQPGEGLLAQLGKLAGS